MERARIGIFEDKEMLRGALKAYLETAGHKVVLEAGSVSEIEQIIRDIKPGGIDVILLDGNFTPGEIDSSEGTVIAKRLHEKLGEIAIIDISAHEPIAEVEAHIDKGKTPEILSFINEL